METILPISDLQHRAKKMIEFTRITGESVIVTQNGKPAAVLMDYESYLGLKLSREEMEYPDWEEKLNRAEQDVKKGKLKSLEAYLEKGKKNEAPSHRRGRKRS